MIHLIAFFFKDAPPFLMKLYISTRKNPAQCYGSRSYVARDMWQLSKILTGSAENGRKGLVLGTKSLVRKLPSNIHMELRDAEQIKKQFGLEKDGYMYMACMRNNKNNYAM